MERVVGEFLDGEGAKCAKAVLRKSLRAIGSSDVKIKCRKKRLEISVSDRNPAKEKAAKFGAKRLMGMLLQIDKDIK